MADLALVAGGSGFIGRHLCIELLQMGFEVVAASRTAPNIEGVRHLSIDVTNRDELLQRVRDISPRWVFNLVGTIEHAVVWPRQRDLVRLHFETVLNLVEAFANKNVETFLSVGSADEYGDQPAPLSELLRERPIAPYSAAKVAATHYLQMMFERVGFPAVVARLFLVYGPGQDDRRLIPQVCKGLLASRDVAVTEGNQLRDFLYVEDAARGLIALAGAASAKGGVFNLATGEPVPVRLVLQKLWDIIGTGQVLFGARPARQGEPPDSHADISALTSLGVWQPRWNLDRGLRKTVEYCRMSTSG